MAAPVPAGADWLVPDWPAPPGVWALCTTRTGGSSLPPYDSLNLGTHVGDDPPAVRANRQTLQAAVQARTPTARAVFLNQVHGHGVVAVAGVAHGHVGVARRRLRCGCARRLRRGDCRGCVGPVAAAGGAALLAIVATEESWAEVVNGTGTVVLGIHIAAPGLAIQPGSAIDQLGRARLSTVYMPGYKITMLPDDVVQTYTLDEGRANPAVSLYVTIDEATLEFKSSETRLERVHVVANLRHDQLDSVVTEEWLSNPAFEHQNDPQRLSDLRPQLSFLHRLAKDLKARREVVRGKPENFNRPDYNFRLVGNNGAEPTGDEQVQISVRQRGAPLDLIVAEAMIVANSTWGSWMAELGVPGIYRSQASMAPGVKVRMGTKALPHAGIGVKAYSWATSPLRRYTDLVNQWQIIACARHGKTAALAAPFKPKDADLFSIISSFDGAYSAYNGYQAGMERFWTLKYVEQNGITELNATVFKEGPGGSFLVRADDIPLVFPVLGAQNLPRGARLKVKLGEVDEITLDIHGTVIERLDDPADTSDDGPVDDAEDDDTVAGPIAIAVDVNEAPAEAAAAAPAA